MDFVRTNNNTLNITGTLVHSDGFFQILEGEDILVKTIFDKIKKMGGIIISLKCWVKK